MKTSYAVLLTVVLTIIGMSILRGQTEPQQSTARFQVVTSKYVVIQKPGYSVQEEGTIRLDTQSGRAWLLAMGVNKEGEFYQMWSSINEEGYKAKQ